jgi:hypothetical protein
MPANAPPAAPPAVDPPGDQAAPHGAAPAAPHGAAPAAPHGAAPAAPHGAAPAAPHGAGPRGAGPAAPYGGVPWPAVPGEASAQIDLAATAVTPSWARQFARAVLGAWQLAPDLTDTAVLLVSELISNAGAPRGALTYPRCSREELKGGSWA